MAKISPVSIKYIIHAKFESEGAVEKPHIIGAIFGQTEGLLGEDLEMRELQKEGKIGRIEVDFIRLGVQKNEIKGKLLELETKETEIAKKLEETHGQGTLHLGTGEFTKQ